MTTENNGIHPVTSRRESLMARMQAKYPDKDFSNEDEFYGQISDDFDGYDQELNTYRAHEKALSDMFTADHRSASFISDWRNGEDPTISLIRRFGPDIKDAIDDPALQEKIAEANKEYVQRMEESKQLDEEYQKNISETLAYLDEEVSSGRLQEQDIDDALAFLVGIVHDGIVGKFSPETIDMALRALHHDSDVEEADQAGEVRGRNAKITETLEKRAKTDGTAPLAGKNGGAGTARQPPHLGALDQYGDNNKSIWERGGEHRTRVSR